MSPRSRLYTLDAIVLTRRDHGEADRVVTCLTPQGRVDLLAKGVRKVRSRKAGHLELFVRTRLLVARVEGSWDIVTQAEAMTLHPGLQDDFERGTYARYVSELVIRFFEAEAEPRVFNLLDWALSTLETDENLEMVVRWYEQQLLVLAGFRPEWHLCVGEVENTQCGQILKPRPSDREPYGLDLERGGALCHECATAMARESSVRFLSPSGLSWLQALQRRPYDELRSLPFPQRTARELERLMQEYIVYHLELRPRTLRMFGMGRSQRPGTG